jgi:hypothetical protein
LNKSVRDAWLRPIMRTILYGCFSSLLFSSCLETASIYQSPDNPPRFLDAGSGPDTIKTGDVIRTTLVARDDDGDSIVLTTPDSGISILRDTLIWRPAGRDTGWKTVTVYADDRKGGRDTLIHRFYVVYFNPYHLVATLTEGLKLSYSVIQVNCEGRCNMGGMFWEIEYPAADWNFGDVPSITSRILGFYETESNGLHELYPNECGSRVRVDSLEISPDTTIIKVHQEQLCQPIRKADNYYLSGLGLFYAVESDSRESGRFTTYLNYRNGISTLLYNYVSVMDSFANAKSPTY